MTTTIPYPGTILNEIMRNLREVRQDKKIDHDAVCPRNHLEFATRDLELLVDNHPFYRQNIHELDGIQNELSAAINYCYELQKEIDVVANLGATASPEKAAACAEIEQLENSVIACVRDAQSKLEAIFSKEEKRAGAISKAPAIALKQIMENLSEIKLDEKLTHEVGHSRNCLEFIEGDLEILFKNKEFYHRHERELKTIYHLVPVALNYCHELQNEIDQDRKFTETNSSDAKDSIDEIEQLEAGVISCVNIAQINIKTIFKNENKRFVARGQ